jgi:uncharacterized protein (TIGR00251 family)
VIEVTDHADGCVLHVRAQPGARRNGINGAHAGAVKVCVTAPPDKGRANDAIIDVLAAALAVKRARIELIAGAASRAKKFLVHGLTSDHVRARLTPLT